MTTPTTNNPPYTKRCRTQPFVVVGCIVEYNEKFALVQEKLGSDKGLWNQPAGWLDLNEKIIDGALRETQEETGLEIELTGFLGIYNLVKSRYGKINHAVKLIFAAKALHGKFKINSSELLDAQWFSLAEVEALGDKIRDPDIAQAIKDYQAGKIIPLDNLETYTNVFNSKKTEL